VPTLPFANWLPDPVPRSVRDADGRLGPPVPRGRRVALPRRGTMFVREVAGPRGTSTIVLLQGWMASGERFVEPLPDACSTVASPASV
jgi:hypothetical protein